MHMNILVIQCSSFLSFISSPHCCHSGVSPLYRQTRTGWPLKNQNQVGLFLSLAVRFSPEKLLRGELTCDLVDDLCTESSGQPGKRKRGRPRRHPPKEQHKSPMQAFLVQMADGQTLMMQIPTASIPTGMDLHDVAQNIANSLNAAAVSTICGLAFLVQWSCPMWQASVKSNSFETDSGIGRMLKFVIYVSCVQEIYLKGGQNKPAVMHSCAIKTASCFVFFALVAGMKCH